MNGEILKQEIRALEKRIINLEREMLDARRVVEPLADILYELREAARRRMEE